MGSAGTNLEERDDSGLCEFEIAPPSNIQFFSIIPVSVTSTVASQPGVVADRKRDAMDFTGCQDTERTLEMASSRSEPGGLGTTPSRSQTENPGTSQSDLIEEAHFRQAGIQRVSGRQAKDVPSDDAPSNSEPTALTDEWIQRVYPSVHRVAWTLTGDANAAEDLAQETFVVALQQWDRFKGQSKRTTWLLGITVRLSRKHFRSLSRLRQRLERVFASKNLTVHDNDHAIAIAHEEWRTSIWSAVAQLPRLQAETITLRFGSELSYEEIAAAMNCPIGTAKTRVHHGLAKLREFHSIDIESTGLE